MAVIQTLVSNPVDNADSDAQSFGTNPVAGRSVIVVVEGWHSATAFACPAGSVTDNQGNTYTPVVTTSVPSGTAAVAILCCGVIASSGTFTITVNPTGTGNYFSWVAYEVSGLDPLTPIRTFLANAVSAAFATTAPTTGASSNCVMVGDLAIVVLTTTTNQASITVETVSPVWVESMEQLSNSHEPGEIDQRVLTANGSVTGNWTLATAAPYAAAIAIFAVAPTPDDATVLTVARDASTWAIAGVDVGPAALYDVTANKTVIPYMGLNDSTFLAYYDHAAHTFTLFGSLFASGTMDSHGVPCIVQDSVGKYHVFGGCHITPLKYSRSTNANDPTAWTAQTDVTSTAAYPNAWHISDGTLVVFYRAGGHTADWVRRSSTNAGVSWNAEVAILDSTAANVWYLTAVQIGDFIHMMIVWKDETNTKGSSDPEFVQRYGVYYVKWDAAGTGNWLAADGTILTTPITKATLDASCVVRAEDSGNGNYDLEGSITVGADGYPAILNTRGHGTSHTAAFSKWNGSSWNAPVTIASTGIDAVNDSGLLVENGVNGWIAYIVRNGTPALVGDADTDAQTADIGGNIDRYTSVDNGVTWQRQGVVSNRPRLNYPARVVNGIAPIKYLSADYSKPAAGIGAIVGFTDAVVTVASSGLPAGRTYQQICVGFAR